MTSKSTGANRFNNLAGRAARLATLGALAGMLAACGRVGPADEPVGPKSGPPNKFDPERYQSIFGEGGLSIGNLQGGRVGGILGGPEDKARLPVNKFIWQAALDTLSFLPLASTDPFTGVIATDWGTTPQAPGERFKVTAYVLGSGLSAASLKVAVYREVQTDKGRWVPAPVSADTARKLEDAILTRARQIRIAGLEEKGAG
jgi:hypothetical protein